jgi:pyruvate formate lyase activating enzyme
MHEAMLYERMEGQRVRCGLCAHRCTIGEGQRGLCQVRENRAGVLYSLVYGQLVSQALDPIEKKPLFHFYPASSAFSVATVGCNLRCAFCQNAEISQMPRDEGRVAGRAVAAEAVVSAAQRQGSRSIAYTYTEPTIFAEYNYDIAQLAHRAGIANVYVTNGYMTTALLDLFTSPTALPLLDAANVDLKSFRDAFYRQQCGATLQPVLDNLVLMKRRGVWVEVTTLLIPGLNDDEQELRELAQFIATALGPETPWHVSRFHPDYRLTDRPPTPAATLHRAREIGLQAGLRYVYQGNLPGGGGEDTACPHCGKVVIQRQVFTVLRNQAHGGVCVHCGGRVDGVGL